MRRKDLKWLPIVKHVESRQYPQIRAIFRMQPPAVTRRARGLRPDVPILRPRRAHLGEIRWRNPSA